jgi:hypothetical protein
MPQPYEWDYARTDCDSNPLYETFSVPVFQWIPKASGKGLKKSKTIRVNGYIADPQTAYDKAAELCRQLNEAGVRLDDPPKWLQKTYSVPKPDGVVRTRTNDELTPGKVRTIRERVARERLLPAGFIKGTDATYVRRWGEQIHLIYFHAYGQELDLRFGFHFAFVPPRMHSQRPIPLNEFREYHCALEAGMGSFISDPGGFQYGRDPAALEATLTSAVNLAIALFDRYAKQREEPSAVLAEIDADALKPWTSYDRDTLAAWILVRLGRIAEAEARLRELPMTPPDIRKYIKPIDPTTLKDWVLPPTTPALAE